MEKKKLTELVDYLITKGYFGADENILFEDIVMTDAMVNAKKYTDYFFYDSKIHNINDQTKVLMLYGPGGCGISTFIYAMTNHSLYKKYCRFLMLDIMKIWRWKKIDNIVDLIFDDAQKEYIENGIMTILIIDNILTTYELKRIVSLISAILMRLENDDKFLFLVVGGDKLIRADFDRWKNIKFPLPDFDTRKILFQHFLSKICGPWGKDIKLTITISPSLNFDKLSQLMDGLNIYEIERIRTDILYRRLRYMRENNEITCEVTQDICEVEIKKTLETIRSIEEWKKQTNL